LFERSFIMETFIVYFDDADWALRQIEPLIGRSDGALPSAQWVLVACPPRLGRHAGRWVTRAVRESDRSERAAKLFEGVTPWLQARGARTVECVGRGSLEAMTRDLRLAHGQARVLDARRPRFGQTLEPVTPGQPVAQASHWQVPGAVAGMGAALLLAAE